MSRPVSRTVAAIRERFAAPHNDQVVEHDPVEPVASHDDDANLDPREIAARRLVDQANQHLAGAGGCDELRADHVMNGGQYERDPVYVVTCPDDHPHATSERFRGRAVLYATEIAGRFVATVQRLAANGGVDPEGQPEYPEHLQALLDVAHGRLTEARIRVEQCARDLEFAEHDVAAAEHEIRDITDRRYPQWLAEVEMRKAAEAQAALDAEAAAQRHVRLVDSVRQAAHAQGLDLVAIERRDLDAIGPLADAPTVTDWFLVGTAEHAVIRGHLVGGSYVEVDGRVRRNPEPQRTEDGRFRVPWVDGTTLDHVARYLGIDPEKE